MAIVSRPPERHGLSKTPEYTAWANMIKRCTPGTAAHAQVLQFYGARGITVCDRWRKSFTAFIADVGPRPSKQHSLDRIDNDKGYEPGNVRWATRQEQALNRRSNRLITFKGKTLSDIEWARQYGLNPGVISDRISRGWSVERAITTPSRGCKRWNK